MIWIDAWAIEDDMSKKTAKDKTDNKVDAKAETQVENAAVSNAEQQAKPEIFAVITQPDGTQLGLDAAAFGHLIKNSYSSGDESAFTPLFIQYRESHAMAPVLERLKAGLDEISIDYIDHHERLIDFARIRSHVLLNNDFKWTQTDKILLDRNKQMVAAGTPPFLQEVNLEWSSSYTNLYGLYDLPAKAEGEDKDPIGSLEWIDGKAVLDVGGYIGDTMKLFRDLFPNSKIHCVEPVKKNFEHMSKLMPEDVKEGHIIPVNVGFGNEAGKMRISGRQGGDVDSTTSLTFDYQRDDTYEEVEVITLDSYVKEHNLEVGLIKVDVEGFEPNVILGALETIKAQRPVLVIAMYHTAQEFYELKPYIESLNLGYKFQVRRSCFGNMYNELVLVCYPTEQDAK